MKTLLLASICLFIFSLYGCGEENNNPVNPPPSSPDTSIKLISPLNDTVFHTINVDSVLVTFKWHSANSIPLNYELLIFDTIPNGWCAALNPPVTHDTIISHWVKLNNGGICGAAPNKFWLIAAYYANNVISYSHRGYFSMQVNNNYSIFHIAPSNVRIINILDDNILGIKYFTIHSP